MDAGHTGVEEGGGGERGDISGEETRGGTEEETGTIERDIALTERERSKRKRRGKKKRKNREETEKQKMMRVIQWK